VEYSEYEKLKKENEVLMETLEFYAQGGYPEMDMWQHPDLGYFTGKRARQTLEQADKIRSKK
ncbi:MAG: hypothetical protein ACK5T9_02865, partial [Bacteroidota bacterium]